MRRIRPEQEAAAQVLRDLTLLLLRIGASRRQLVHMRPVEDVGEVQCAERVHFVVRCERQEAADPVELQLQLLQGPVGEDVRVVCLEARAARSRHVAPVGVGQEHLHALLIQRLGQLPRPGRRPDEQHPLRVGRGDAQPTRQQGREYAVHRDGAHDDHEHQRNEARRTRVTELG